MTDEIDEILRAFHYETFRAGVCYERDEWPHSDEEWTSLNRDIQSEAVGEHFEGWAGEMLDKLRAAIATEARRAETVKQGSVHEGAGRRHRP